MMQFLSVNSIRNCERKLRMKSLKLINSLTCKRWYSEWWSLITDSIRNVMKKDKELTMSVVLSWKFKKRWWQSYYDS